MTTEKPQDNEFVLRLIDEHKQLLGRLEKLHTFTKTESFESLPNHHKALLIQQGNAMSMYSFILSQRISLIQREYAIANQEAK